MAKANVSDYRFPQGLIQIFAKAPVLGQVKTRLRQALTDAEIVEIYKKMLKQVIDAALEARICPVELRVALDPGHEFFQPYVDSGAVMLKPQSQGDLGQRMALAFHEVLAKKDFVIAIGGDCVSIDGVYLQEAAQLLDAGQDVVFGPAEDGGYILLGLRTLYSEIFQGIPWGESNVLALSVQKLERSHVNYAFLSVGWDLDTPADLQRYQGCT